MRVRSTHVGWEGSVLGQHTRRLSTERRSDTRFIWVTVKMTSREIRTNSVSLLPFLDVFAYGNNLSSHIRTWDDVFVFTGPGS